MPKIKVSIPTYNEIAALLEQNGFKLGENVKELTLEKGTELVQPVDYRLVTIRRDVMDIASKTFDGTLHDSFVDYVNELYLFVLNQKIPNYKTASELQLPKQATDQVDQNWK